MSSERPKREKAGNRMASLINNEEEDDFYKNIYDGFKEEENDLEYQSGFEGSTDVSDSDISVSENEEIVENQELEIVNEKKITKTALVQAAIKKSTLNKRGEVPKAKNVQHPQVILDDKTLKSKMEVRQSTLNKSTVTKLKHIDHVERSQKFKKIWAERHHGSYKKFTQAELLEQAKTNEQINLKSLEKYQNQEAELKKKARSIKKKCQFQSYVRTLSTLKSIKKSVDDEPMVQDQSLEETIESITEEQPSMFTQNYLIFNPEENINTYFPANNSTHLRPVEPRICPVTGKVAHYIDPLTNTPYHDVAAFKVLRAANEQNSL